MALKSRLRRTLAPLKGSPAWPWLQRLGRAYDMLGVRRRAFMEEARWKLRLRWVARSPDAQYERWLNLERAPAPSGGPGPSFLILVWCPEGADASRSVASARGQRYRGAVTVREVRGLTRAGKMNEAALAYPSAEWLVFLEAGDAIEPDALAQIAAAGEGAQLVYTDEDRLHREGAPPWYERPFFKPGWSPDTLLSADYTGGAKAIRREVFAKVGGLREGFDDGEHDLLLRALPLLTKVRHVERVLYHRAGVWPASSPAAVREHVARTYGAPFALGEQGLTYGRAPTVSVIIPFKDKPELLRDLTRSIFSRTAYPSYELVLVSNNSREPETFALLDELRARPNVRVLIHDQPFNWSAVNNAAARTCQSEVLLFLNNDMEVGNDRWLEALVAHTMRPDVCVTGAKLYYPDRTIQHYGVVVGMGGGFAGHVFAGESGDGFSYYGPTDWIRDCTAVTGACLMVRRDTFQTLGGFDETFILCGSDVEFCMRAARGTGARVVCTPEATLVHYESKSRGTEIPFNDFVRSLEHYEPYLRDGDPYYNRNLSLRTTRLALRLSPEDALAQARAVVGDAREARP